MSEILKSSIDYIKDAKLGLLITTDEKVPYVRLIGAFYNEGKDIYFLTRKGTAKVKQISLNPVVTFYVEKPDQPYESFKSAAFSGEAQEVSQGIEFEKAVEGISHRYPIIVDLVKGEDKNSVLIYKIKTSLVKFTYYTKSPKETVITI